MSCEWVRFRGQADSPSRRGLRRVVGP
jgi:hypothetical protein